MVDEGAGTACADAVHAFFRRAAEVHDLGVFASQFHHGIGLGNQFFHCRGRRDNFLYEGQLQPLGDAHAGRTGEGETETHVGEHVFIRSGRRAVQRDQNITQFSKVGHQCRGNVGEVAGIFLVDKFFIGVQHDYFNGRRSDINAHFAGRRTFNRHSAALQPGCADHYLRFEIDSHRAPQYI